MKKLKDCVFSVEYCNASKRWFALCDAEEGIIYYADTPHEAIEEIVKAKKAKDKFEETRRKNEDSRCKRS